MEKIVGIDVSKDWLDVHVLASGGTLKVGNDHAGMDELIGWLAADLPDVVALEATGGLESLCVAALSAAGLAVIVVNPAQVRAYAGALGQRAKTDPIDAAVIAAFVKATQVDALAIAIGTSHGAYKFTKPPTGDVLSIERIKEIHKRIPNTHLVMHGSSSVPQEWLKVINEFGGDIKETYGVPVEEIVEGIKHGVRKVNIDTDIRLAMTAAIRRFMNQNKSAFDPRDYLKPARAAAKEICKQRYQQFGCASQGSKLQPLPLEKMASRYARGELAAVVN